MGKLSFSTGHHFQIVMCLQGRRLSISQDIMNTLELFIYLNSENKLLI